MRARVFPTLREAIHHTATRSGKSMKEIAAELDWSPTMLSFVTTLGEDNQRGFPVDEAHLVRLMTFTEDYSPLATLADKLGFELVPKRERTAEEVSALRQDLAAFGKRIEQLSLDLGQGRKAHR